LLHQGPDIVPIPGTRRIERLEENAAATHVELSSGELDSIEQALVNNVVVGTRYPQANMSSVNR
jgi:aryl-alcohol dehydrogenase-like predicted oxidoreductase